MPLWVVRSAGVLSGILLLLPATARAEDGAPPRLGDTDWALPGIARVGVPDVGPRRFAASGSAGYGYLEPQSSTDGAHNRAMGTLAAAIAPTPALELALRFDGRYDHHPDDDSGAVGDPRFLARYGAAAGSDFRLGGELGLWLPGQSAPSIAFGATTVDAKLLGAWTPPSGPRVAVMGGFRLDNSAHAISHADRLRFGDRLVLGLSDFDAALVGVGVSIPVAKTEILGEVSGDLLVGSGAPKITESPLRATAGVREYLSRAFSVELLAEASLSARPSIGPTDPLIPIEPRLSVLGGIRYTLPFDEPGVNEPTKPAQPITTAPVATAPTAPTAATIIVQVLGEDGKPVATATVDIRIGDAEHPATGDAEGNYRATDVPAGDAKIAVTADGFVAAEQSVHVGPETTAPIQVRLKAVPPSGQLRGLVRSFDGRGLAASIRVEPIGTESKADAQGAFTIDVPPGDYQVVIHAPKYKDQKRKIHVDENGVTVLNAELFEAK